MNFLPAEVASGMVTLANGARLAGGGTASGEVTLGLRPEHLIADETGPIEINVQLCEQLGAITLLHGHLSGTDVECVASMPGHVSAAPGTLMRFAIAPEHLHMFDTQTGKRVDA